VSNRLLSADEATEELIGLSGTDLEMIRLRAENDLYFMAKGILGMKDLYPPLHRPFCQFIETEGADMRRRMALMPRGTLKSSISTVANNVRRAVRNPEVRILIANEVYDNASDFMSEIQGHFEKNRKIRLLWPHVVPEKFAGAGVEWSSKGASVVRNGIYKEPTWFPIGVGGAVTSKHFTHIDGDDLIGLAAYDSPAEMLKAIRWNRNIEPLCIDSEGDNATIITWLGTRWAGNDLYADVEKIYGQILKVYHQGCFTADGKSVFPRKLSLEFLERIAANEPDRFAAQYLNDPTSSAVLDFEYAKLQTFTIDSQRWLRWRTDGEDFETNANMLDRVMTVDPNGGKRTSPDEFAVGITASDHQGNVFSLEDYGGRPTVEEACKVILDMYLKWRPRIIGIEETNSQNWLYIVEKHFTEQRVSARFERLKPNNQAKEERIRTCLQPLLAYKKLFVPTTQLELRNQIKNYPGVDFDDRIDRFAYGTTLIRTPFSEAHSKRHRSTIKKLLNLRSHLTGY